MSCSYIAPHMRRVFIVLILTVIFLPSKGQLNNSSLEWPANYEDVDSGRFYAGFRTLGFMRNNEYFNEVLEGYTLFGYQLNPFLAWQASGNLRFEAGLFLEQSFGEDDFTHILPTFTINYTRNNHQLILGTLQGNVSHRLIEPLYDFENLLDDDRIEYGLQYRFVNNQLFLDTWIDWRQAIAEGDTDQEELLAGISAEYKWLNLPASGFSTLLQVTGFNRGGQINDSNLPVQTYFNTAFGLKGWKNFSGFLSQFSADVYYVAFSDNSGTTLLPFDSGDGFYANLFLNTRTGLGLMLSYWQSEQYFAPIGGRLYQNYSYRQEQSGEEIGQRDLLFFRLLYERTLADVLHLSLRGEPYLDLNKGEMEWSLGLYLNYDIQFGLGKKSN